MFGMSKHTQCTRLGTGGLVHSALLAPERLFTTQDKLAVATPTCIAEPGYRRRYVIWDVEAHPSTRLGTGGRHLLKAGMGAIQKWVVAGALTDPDVVLYAAWISVWGRWFVWLVGVFLLAYRPGFWYPQDIELLLLHVLLLSINSLVHHRLLTKRPVTWRWMLFLCAMDIALITAYIVIDDGFGSFIFLAYYPSLAIFAAVFLSSRLTLAWTTAIAVAYAAVCLMVGSGLDLDAGKEKALVARLAAMYTTVLGISLINRFERIRWRTAVASERQLRQERIELSHTPTPPLRPRT